MRLILVITGFLFFEANALYSKSSGVVDLNANNFDNRVKDSEGVWIVEFYAPWCGHCKQLAPEYQKAAKALKGIIGVGGVNCDEHKQLCGQFGVQGFPTIKIFGSNKAKPEDYQGQRTAAGIVQAAQKNRSEDCAGPSRRQIQQQRRQRFWWFWRFRRLR